MQTASKRRLDDVMADIKRLTATVQQKLKGFVAVLLLYIVLLEVK